MIYSLIIVNNYCVLGNWVIPNEIKFSWLSTINIFGSILQQFFETLMFENFIAFH